MTTYFDDYSRKLHDLRAELRTRGFCKYEALAEVESTIVRDCTLASSASLFPPALRRQIHEIVLRYGVTELPPNAKPADFEDTAEHLQRLGNLGSDLHSVFHAVAEAGIPGYGDTPLSIVYAEWICPLDIERGEIAVEFGGEDPEAYVRRLSDPTAEPDPRQEARAKAAEQTRALLFSTLDAAPAPWKVVALVGNGGWLKSELLYAARGHGARVLNLPWNDVPPSKLSEAIKRDLGCSPTLVHTCSPHVLSALSFALTADSVFVAGESGLVRKLSDHPTYAHWRYGTQLGELWAAFGDDPAEWSA